MSAIDLTTVAKVKAYGDLSSNADSVLEPLVTSASASFMTLTERSDYINGQFSSEIREGTGTTSMMLFHFPVISIAALHSCGQVIPPILDGTSGSPRGYLIDLVRGHLRLLGYVFPRGSMTQIDYFYGYATVPPDVEQAVNEMVLFVFRKRAHIDIVTQTLAQQITRYLDKLPQTTRDIINYYKKKRLVGYYSIGSGGSGPILTGGLQKTSFVADGSTNIFTLPVLPTGGTAWFRNGVLQTPPDDYTQAGTVITVALPAIDIIGDNFTAVYAI